MSQIKLYSPNQVLLGAFLGGPLSAIYYLRSNFKALRNKKLARKTLYLGLILVLLGFIILFFLPDSFSFHIIPIIYAAYASHLVHTRQMTKKMIKKSDQHCFQSTWKLLGISIIGAILFIIISFILTFVLFMLLDLTDFSYLIE